MLKIKTCFFKNKAFAKNEVSNIHQSADRKRESDSPNKFDEDLLYLSEYQEYQEYSRTTSVAFGNNPSMINSVLDRNDLKHVDSMQ